MSTIIHHGTTSQGSTPPLTVQASMMGEFGSGNASTGRQLYSANGNINVIRANDSHTNMPNPPLIIVAGSTFSWFQTLEILVTSVTGGTVAWNGSVLDPNFTFAFSVTEAAFSDVCNVWTPSSFNTKGFADMNVTFAPGGFGHPCTSQPPIGSFSPDYTPKVVVTEISSGRTGQAILPTIKFQNDTHVV